MEALSEVELVRHVAARADTASAAEAELCRRFGERIRLYGLRHLRDAERARDLVQAVLLSVIVAIREDKVADPEHLERYVLGTCRNMAHRTRARESRALPTPPEDLDVLSFVPDTTSLDLGALRRCMGALEPRARKVVELSFHDDRSSEEIATVLETTPGNVRVMRHRAVAALRRCLEGPQEVR